MNTKRIIKQCGRLLQQSRVLVLALAQIRTTADNGRCLTIWTIPAINQGTIQPPALAPVAFAAGVVIFGTVVTGLAGDATSRCTLV